MLQSFVEKSGSWYSYNGERIRQGKENARNFLNEHPKIAQTIEARIREKLLPPTKKGEATKGEDATKVGAGAGVGAVIGGLLGGGSGAAKGAAIGGAAGAGAVLATRGREIELPAGSNVNATLASGIDVRVR